MLLISLLIIGVTIITVCFSTVHGIGLWALLMITHGVIHHYLGPGTEHLPLFTGVLVSIIILIRQEWRNIKLTYIIFFSSILIVMCVSAIQGINLSSSLIHILLYSKGLLLVILLVGCLHKDRDIKIMTLYLLIGITFGALMAFYQFATDSFTINTIYMQRAATLRGDPNDTAMLFVAGVPLSIYWQFNTRGVSKVLALLSTGALIGGIVLTMSRGGFVALLFVLVFIVIKYFSFRMILYSLFFIFLMALLVPGSYWDRMGSMVTGKEKYGSKSLEKRLLLQKKGIDILLNNPVLGVGPGNYGREFIKRYNPTRHLGGKNSKDTQKSYAVAHNMYLEFYSEMGLIGGSMFIALFIYTLRGLFRYDKFLRKTEEKMTCGLALALGLSGMLLSGLFLSQGKNSVLWFMIGIGFSAGDLAKKYIRVNKYGNSTEQRNLDTNNELLICTSKSKEK